MSRRRFPKSRCRVVVAVDTGLLAATATAIPRPAVEADAVAHEAVPAVPWEDTELPADTRTADTIRDTATTLAATILTDTVTARRIRDTAAPTPTPTAAATAPAPQRPPLRRRAAKCGADAVRADAAREAEVADAADLTKVG